MSYVTLTVFRDGHAILSTPDQWSYEQVQEIKRHWDDFISKDAGLLVLPMGEVRVVELDLTAEGFEVVTA